MTINEQMESIGWLFCQIEHNEWRWQKFDPSGMVKLSIAEYGDDVWNADYAMFEFRREYIKQHSKGGQNA